ncbi:unnamed protein product [Pleuronectes platessa]|uniref:Uncharacterized protein n=1 Tax=Pleuronectes platessa TaxID=8262 RepID=A0A9N7VU06_PLEPL|nr:unnamed protein product [Pleuronectes platessa]
MALADEYCCLPPRSPQQTEKRKPGRKSECDRDEEREDLHLNSNNTERCCLIRGRRRAHNLRQHGGTLQK